MRGHPCAPLQTVLERFLAYPPLGSLDERLTS